MRIFGFITKRSAPSKADACEADQFARFSDADMRAAALKIVHPLVNVTPGWLGVTPEQTNREQETINELRQRFANQQPIRLRNAISGWLDFYDRRIAEARKDTAKRQQRDELIELLKHVSNPQR